MDLVVCDQCQESVDRDRLVRHQEEECQKHASIPKPKRVSVEDKFKNQHGYHLQVWMIVISVVTILLALAVGLSQKQTDSQQESVNMTHVQALNKSMAELAQSLEQLKKMSQADKETLTAMLEGQETSFNRSLQELEKKLRNTLCPGSNAERPGFSCQQILNCNVSSPSGYYWIASADGNATHMYCSMNKTCGEASGGWMRVAELDMRNSGSQCPSGLKEVVHSGQKLCGIGKEKGSECLFNVSNVRYEQVCGKIIAYQFGSTDSFFRMYKHYENNIGECYLDGISLTYSKNPRRHIWSFAAALDEVGTRPESNCQCTNTKLAPKLATAPPDFVGNDYFCDTGSKNKIQTDQYILYTDDPLWDGAGCGPDNTCCSLNNPPWFFKQLQSSTSEDIEMRVCCDQKLHQENIYIEQIELYVR